MKNSSLAKLAHWHMQNLPRLKVSAGPPVNNPPQATDSIAITVDLLLRSVYNCCSEITLFLLEAGARVKPW
jgi:hypothetical protein